MTANDRQTDELICAAVPLADERHGENVLLLDATLTMLCRNPRFRDVVLTLLYLAALPSRRLDDVHRAARNAWFEAQREKRELEQYHGFALPPCPCDDYPAPSWSEGAQ